MNQFEAWEILGPAATKDGIYGRVSFGTAFFNFNRSVQLGGLLSHVSNLHGRGSLKDQRTIKAAAEAHIWYILGPEHEEVVLDY